MNPMKLYTKINTLLSQQNRPGIATQAKKIQTEDIIKSSQEKAPGRDPDPPEIALAVIHRL